MEIKIIDMDHSGNGIGKIDNKVVSSIKSIKKDDKLTITLNDGIVNGIVESTNKN